MWKFKLDLSNYEIKGYLKKQPMLIHQISTKKIDLASLKSEINKLGIGKLETTPVGLIKVSCVVKNEVVKIILYDELVKKS